MLQTLRRKPFGWHAETSKIVGKLPPLNQRGGEPRRAGTGFDAEAAPRRLQQAIDVATFAKTVSAPLAAEIPAPFPRLAKPHGCWFESSLDHHHWNVHYKIVRTCFCGLSAR